ncbi:hypothetical protein AGIG_G12732 [Arapaima gigas]
MVGGGVGSGLGHRVTCPHSETLADEGQRRREQLPGCAASQGSDWLRLEGSRGPLGLLRAQLDAQVGERHRRRFSRHHRRFPLLSRGVKGAAGNSEAERLIEGDHSPLVGARQGQGLCQTAR